MPASPAFTSANTTAAFQLRFHFGWYSHGRRPYFDSTPVAATIREHLADTVQRHKYHLLEADVQPSVVRSLLSLKPHHSPSRVTNIVRGNLAKHLREQVEMRNIWSRGTFVRSVGNVAAEVIRRYVASQFDHHRAAPLQQPESAERARFCDPRDPSQLRRDSHSVFEYNLHVVFVTERRTEFLDFEVAESLVGYWRRVCEKYRWIAWNIGIVWDHAHLLLGLRPKDDPEQVALNLMNNSEYFCERRYGAAMRESGLTRLWQPSFYAGTCGAATTAQVKSFLAGENLSCADMT